ncbi:transposase [Aureimonas pseudogalii]|uniref:transposase n=1 Tax=Aureimonas pseudogalii TaxID=1744844 RepID=UPI001FEC628C|nr:transposase [Aureimonas pseudogalii]
MSQKRTTEAAKRLLIKALNRSPHNRPSVISTGKNPAYNQAIALLRRQERLAATCQHRQAKYLNNRLRVRPRQAEAADPACARVPV